jgi:hypothetical protein
MPSGFELLNPRILKEAAGAGEIGRDPWFNPNLFPCTERAYEVVAPVVRAMEQYGRKRALRAKDRQTLHSVLTRLVVNLTHHYLIGGPGQGIPVPRSKRDKTLGGKANRYQTFSFPRSFPKMLDGLCALGFAEQIIGDAGKFRRTTIKAGPKLIELIKEHKVKLEDLQEIEGEEIIILKGSKRGHWDEGARIDYPDTPTTNRFRSELRDINFWLAKADILFGAAAYDHPVDVQARRLRRNFTLGRFDRGGRLFGGFWETLPKSARSQGIRIEGEPVVGLDYSQLNPLLAYYVAKAVPPPGDAYTLPGFEKYRDGVKKIFNAMLFKSPLKKFPKGARVLFPRLIKCEDVTGAILLRHPNLKGVLSVFEIGHQFQYLESEIMMGVLRKCRKGNIVALPVFDSVVVKSSAENTVRKIMLREFKAVTGLEAMIKRESSKSGNLQASVEVDIYPGTGL